MSGWLWPKGLHIIFMVSWFAGLFYLPRLFVYHAESTEPAVQAQLKVMERRLYLFVTPWMILTVLFGLWMLWAGAWAAWSGMLWLHLKLAAVAVLVGYHFYCGRLVRVFREDRNTRPGRWYRWFNEFPLLLLVSIVLLASLKPF